MYYLIIILCVLFIYACIYNARLVYKSSYIPRFNNKSYPIIQTAQIHAEILKLYPNVFLYPVNIYPCIKENAFNEKNQITYIDNGVNRFHPTLACVFGIVRFEKYIIDNDNIALNDFNNHINQILEHIIVTDDLKGVFVPFEFDFFNEKAPWTSGITQAFLISMFVRKFIVSKENKYLDIAFKAFDFMNRPSENMKGARFSNSDMKLWYEEDPHNHHILNGNLYAIFSVYELNKCIESDTLKQTMSMALDSLKSNLAKYDTGFFSRYDLSKNSISNGPYHRLHVNVLNAMYHITGDVIYKKYSDRFDKYTKNPLYKTRLFVYLYLRAILAKFKITI